MRALALLVGTLCLLGCGPGPSTPDAGSGACLDTSKTPSNLIENPHFECDSSAAEWAAVSGYGTLELAAGGRTGRAAKVTVGGLGARLQYTKAFAPSPAGNKTYCFSAWLSGTAPFMRMRVLRDFDGSVQEVAFSEQIFPDFRRTHPQGHRRQRPEAAPRLRSAEQPARRPERHGRPDDADRRRRRVGKHR